MYIYYYPYATDFVIFTISVQLNHNGKHNLFAAILLDMFLLLNILCFILHPVTQIGNILD